MIKKISYLALAGLIPLAVMSCTSEVEQQSNASTAKVNQITNQYEKEALEKLATLTSMMEQAKNSAFDVTREDTVVWFAKEFLKYANWDQANEKAVTYMFEQYGPLKANHIQLAKDIPDFQRKEVINILDDAIEELSSVMSGEIKRRPVNKVDWQNITVADNVLKSNGRPIFLYDYFSKSVGRPLTDTAVYNDHLGAIFHGGENLYPVDHDRAINSFLIKEDGSFDSELLTEVTSIDNSNVGFLIYWNMGIPQWIEKREPEVRKGRSLFTGYDIDNPLVRETWGTIARETGKLTQGKKVTQLGYILANEPHWFSVKNHWTKNFQEMQELSVYTKENFQTYLKGSYNDDIAALNKNWGTNFTQFSEVETEVPIPRSTRGTPVWYDWCRYNMHRSISWFTHLQGELRKGNPDADTHIKIMPDMFTENARSHGIDVESLTELTSMIGDDAKAREMRNLNKNKEEPWEEHYAYFWEELGMSYDFMESVSPNKIHINSESHFLSASWWRSLETSTEYVESVYWLATILGMDANLAWFWARDPDGSPEDRLEGEINFFDPALAGSFAGSVNQQPHIANAYTQVMYDMNSFSEEIIALREQRRPIRLFHSETSAINKPNHMSQQFKLYENLFFDGFPMGFATEKIINKQDNSTWDAIVVYRTEFVTENELASLQAYLNQGGIVIVDSEKSLSKNQYAQPHNKTLHKGAGELIVLDETVTIDDIKTLALKKAETGLPPITISEQNGTSHRAATWRVVQKENGNYLVNINNLGKHTTKLAVSLKEESKFKITDLFTDNEIDNSFELKSKGVSLLEIEVIN